MMQKAKKLLSLVLIVALLLGTPGIAFAVGNSVEIVPASSRVEVSTEAELRSAVRDAPRDGTQITIALRNDITLVDTLTISTPAGSNIVLTSAGERRTLFQETENRRHIAVSTDTSTRLTLENIVLSGERTPDTVTHNSGGVNVNGGTFTMRAGSAIVSCRHGSTGGAVSVSGGATFIMEAGEIRGNRSNLSGAAVAISGHTTAGGIFIMNDGVIANNVGQGANGGAIHLTGSLSRFTMNGGEIVRNTAERGSGGGIGAFSTGAAASSIEVVINNGIIRNNHAYRDGGGIDISDNQLTINGGAITGNRAGNWGGAINTSNRQTGAFATNTLNPTDYNNITIAAGVVFSHNFAGNGAFTPPENAGITNINTTHTTIHNHPLNNNDVAFRGTGEGTVYDPGPCPGITTETPPPPEGSVFHEQYMIGNAGRFMPRENINRAEVAVILARTMIEDFQPNTLPEGMDSFDAFSDVSATNWFFYYVAWAYNAGLVTGDGQGGFLPRDPITREQLAAMLARTVDYADEAGEMPFLDVASISGWATHFVYTAFREEWMMGDAAGDFRPRANIMRAEVATAVNRMLDRVDSRATLNAITTLHIANAHQFSDVADTAWYFAAVLGAANNHYLARNDDGAIIWKSIPLYPTPR